MKDVFAERFKMARKRAGLTQEEIADVCKNRAGEAPSRSAILQWEKPGGTKPTFWNLVAAVKLMKDRGHPVSIDYLVGLTADENDVSSMSKEAHELGVQWDRMPHDVKQEVFNFIKWKGTGKTKTGAVQHFHAAKDGALRKGRNAK